MADITPQHLNTINIAKIALLELIVRFLLREWADSNGKSSKDMLQVGEALKKAVEAQLSDTILAEATYTAVADDFFNRLATEINRWD